VILVRRGGRHYRVCDPEWQDCLDTSFSCRGGGRWNAPGAFGVLHLCANVAVAAANARKQYENEIHTVFDLEPEFQPILLQVDVRMSEFVDCVSDEGLHAAGLPRTYPADVTWVRTRDVGRKAYALQDSRGVVCRSAALSTGEEVAIFDRAMEIARAGKRYRFTAWYPPLRGASR